MSCCCVPQPLTLNVRQPGRRCGSHIPLQASLFETVSILPEWRCVQTYLGDPTKYQCRSVSALDKVQTAEYCTRTDTTFYVHCPLIANLAKPSAKSSLDVISRELDVVAGLPAACVLHIGKVGTIETVASHINDLMMAGHLPLSTSSRVPFHLLLEIAAGQGTELGRTWEEIRHLYEALDRTRIGLCVDTQHAFASGMCKFETHEDVVKLFDMANYIAPKGISMIHLNDSARPFGSRVDRHAPLREGHIWSASDEGLVALLDRAKEYGMDLITETSNPIQDNIIVQSYMER